MRKQTSMRYFGENAVIYETKACDVSLICICILFDHITTNNLQNQKFLERNAIELKFLEENV